MSLSTGIFYAFLQCDNFQYLAAFPSKSCADQYWRIIQSMPSNDECRRFSTQFMSVPVLPNRMHSNGWDRQSCLVRLIGENQPLPVIPADSRPDFVNGRMFHIRSTIHPEFYWFFEPETRRIGVSRARQSRFMIQRVGSLPYQIRPEEDILIAQDDVLLFVVLSEGHTQGHQVKVCRELGGSGLVQGNGRDESFKFWLFENGFQATYMGEEGPVSLIGPSSGERWELVA